MGAAEASVDVVEAAVAVEAGAASLGHLRISLVRACMHDLVLCLSPAQTGLLRSSRPTLT
jgi:hypothetical protein